MSADHHVATSALRDYLDACLAETTGYLCVAIGSDAYLNEYGKYSHKHWSEHWFAWPAEADRAHAEILRAAPLGDVYVCPYLMRDRRRAKGNAVTHWLAHADVDSGQLDPETVRELGGFAVASGTPGNGHVYIPLAWPVTAPQHELLCRGLARRLGGDKGKINDNDVLRPPGTFNHKPTVTGGDPAPVGPVRP